MSRIQIDFPSRNLFSTKLKVRITDLNYGGHLGNDSVLSLVHEARVRFLKNFGYSELDLGGVGIIMADATIQFKAEAFYGDELVFEIAVDNFSRVAFDIFYRVSCADKIIAIAKTGIVCYNYNLKKVTALPDEVRIKFESKD